MAKEDEPELLDPCIEKVEGGQQPLFVTGKVAYHCKICDCWINSYSSLSDHLSGSRHKQSILNKQKTPSASAVPTKKMDKHTEGPIDPETRSYGMFLIKKLPPDSPVVGLEYIFETQPTITNELTFDCELCGVQTNIGTFIPHLTGFKHKSAFLKKHCEKDYTEIMNFPKKPEQTNELNRRILDYLKIHGQGTVTVKNPSNEAEPNSGDKRSAETEEGPAAKKPATSPQQLKSSKIEDSPGDNKISVKTWEDMETWSRDCEIKNNNEAAVALRMVNIVTAALMKFKVKQMPLVIQEAVEKALADGDDAALEDIIEKYNKGMWKEDIVEPPRGPVDMRGPPIEPRGPSDMKGPNELRSPRDMRGPPEPFGRDMPPRNMPGGRMHGGMEWDRGPGDYWRGPGDGFKNDHFPPRDDHRNPMFERQRPPPHGGPDMRMGRNMFDQPRGFRDDGGMPLRGYPPGPHDMYNRR